MKRFSVPAGEGFLMEPDPSGGFVRHTEVEAMAARLERLEAASMDAMRRFREQSRNAMAELCGTPLENRQAIAEQFFAAMETLSGVLAEGQTWQRQEFGAVAAAGPLSRP